MQVLLSTIGSRGDVQPVVALAAQLNALGQAARVCAPPDFRDQIESLGIPFTPIGPELSSTAKASAPASPTYARAAAPDGGSLGRRAVRGAHGGSPGLRRHRGGAATWSSPRALWPSRWASATSGLATARSSCPRHTTRRRSTPCWGYAADGTVDNRTLWARDAQRYDHLPGRSQRASGISRLAPVDDVRGHMFTDTPWLAADPTLAPWPDPADRNVFQTGAWILPDERPLSPELEAFLDAGEPPIYFGFGSIRAPPGPGPAHDPGGSRARPPRDRAARVGRYGAPGRRTRLHLDRRGQPAGAVPAGRRRRPPRRCRHHHRGRAEPEPPRSSSPSTPTSTTLPSACPTSGSDPPTRPARRPPLR